MERPQSQQPKYAPGARNLSSIHSQSSEAARYEARQEAIKTSLRELMIGLVEGTEDEPWEGETRLESYIAWLRGKVEVDFLVSPAEVRDKANVIINQTGEKSWTITHQATRITVTAQKSENAAYQELERELDRHLRELRQYDGDIIVTAAEIGDKLVQKANAAFYGTETAI